MSELNYNIVIDVKYSYNEIWEVIKNPYNYKEFINSCEEINILETNNKNNKFNYKANVKISTPLKIYLF